MPNQLATSKRRTSLAEHRAVLAALAVLAAREGTTVTTLLRQAARELVRRYASKPEYVEALREAVWSDAPRMPTRFRTAAELARFRRRLREFDELVLELQLEEPSTIQARNSAIPSPCEIRVLEFPDRHLAADV